MGSLRPPPPLQPSVFCFLLPVEGVTSFFSTSLGLAPPGLDSPRSNRLGGPHPAPCRLWAAWSPSPLPATRLPGRFLPGARPSGSPWLSAPSGPGENAALKGGVTCPRTGWSAQGCQVPGPQGPQVSGEASPFGLRLPGFPPRSARPPPPQTCPSASGPPSLSLAAACFQPTSSPCRSMANLSILFGQVSCREGSGGVGPGSGLESRSHPHNLHAAETRRPVKGTP